jgi:hypothetical protein
MAEGVDGHVQLGAFLALGAVIAGPGAAFRGRAQRAAVEDGGARRLAAAGGEPQQAAQIVDQPLEAPGAQPALRLLVDDLPGRQIVGHPAPRRSRLDDVAQAVEHLPQRMNPLPGLLRQKRQIRRDKRPFVVRHIGRIRFAGAIHPANLRNYGLPVPNRL